MPERPPTDDDVEVVKWYTRARRFPQLIGRTPDGATIWGGPYTYTQVIGGVVFLVLGAKTTWLWGQFGLFGNALILLGTTYGLILALGRLPVGSRNPLSVAAGTLRALMAPTQGRLDGRPVRPARPRAVHSPAAVLTTDPAAAALAPPVPDRPRPAVPASAPVVHVGGPALSGVQRLLAGLPVEDA